MPSRPTQPPVAPPPAPAFRLERLLPALTPVVVLAIAIIGYLAVLRPRLFELRTLRVRAAVAADLPGLQQRLAHLERVRDAFDGKLGDVQPFIDASLPEGPDIPNLIATLDAAAQRAGVVVSSVEITREAPPAALTRVLGGGEAVLLGVGLRNANYERTKAFLAAINQSRRLLDPVSLQFTPKRLTATLRVRAYTIK